MSGAVQAVVVKRENNEDVGRLVFRFAEEIIRLLESGHKIVIVRLSDEEDDPEILERISRIVLGYVWQKSSGMDLDTLKEACISAFDYRELVISTELML